jgi:acetyl esterase/lipase
MIPQKFETVWFLPRENRWREFNVLGQGCKRCSRKVVTAPRRKWGGGRKPGSFVIRKTLGVVLFLATLGAAQDVISLYPGTAPGSTQEDYPEKEYFSKVWNTEVVANVTKPSLTVFKPSPELRNGTAVVICPGGGFMALSITSEGTEVANYMTARGVTAFVLKYRLAHTGEDATQEFNALVANRQKYRETVEKIVPQAVADGLTAVTYVRQHGSEWGVSPDRVGIIGFSAGGRVTAGVAFRYLPEGRPAFVAPIYGWGPGGELSKDRVPVPRDAPPMFIAAATDDSFGLAPESIALYEQWTGVQKSAELHLYAKGGHGFGMRKQNVPTDHWIDRFADWLESQGWLKK